MSLLKYFERSNLTLPKPCGPLLTVLPSSTITATNKEVKQVLKRSKTPGASKRGEYEHFTPEEKAQIGQRAAECGVTASIQHFSKVFPGRSLKESSVKTWKMKYLQEIAARKRAGKDLTVKELATKKAGRPLLLGEDLDKQVQAHLAALWENRTVVNTAISIACANGVVKCFDSNLLECNGGHISLTKHWPYGAYGLCQEACKHQSESIPSRF